METVIGYNHDDHEIDLDQVPKSSQIPRRLSGLLSLVADIELVCSALAISSNRMESQLIQLSDCYCPSIRAELLEQVVYLKESLENISIINRRSKDIIQAKVQTVHVPLIM